MQKKQKKKTIAKHLNYLLLIKRMKKKEISTNCVLCVVEKIVLNAANKKKIVRFHCYTFFSSLKYEYEQDTIAQEEKLHFSFFCNEIFTYINNNQA